MLLMVQVVFVPLLAVVGAVSGVDPIRPFPIADQHLASSTTNILNHTSYVDGFAEPQWYLDNIPFIDIPDKFLQDLYYYRQSVVKRHLKFAHQGHGWMFTEFVHPVGWASKLQTIPDSAGHHIVETRWLRNPTYTKDLIQAYTRAGTEKLTGISYTHYVPRAIYEHAEVTGDVDFLTAQLDGLINMYYLWNSTRDNNTGLYHRVPVYDAQEYSLPNYLVGGPNGGPLQEWNDWNNNYEILDKGPETYRPSLNAYMVANAWAITNTARLAGKQELFKTWDAFSTQLEQSMTDMLWNKDLEFWIDVIQGTNQECLGRQLIGYFPYRFGIGTETSFIKGLEKGMDSKHFLTEWGPTTLEQTNPYYTAFKNSTTNTAWNGQSWPFSTGVWLDTLAMIARSRHSSVATSEFFFQQLTTYARTCTLDGQPFVAEAHYPTIDEWSAYDTNHSENYFHSTYVNNIFTNLIGILATLDARLELSPLIPENWTHFAAENIPYHGLLVSLLWDKTGAEYSNFNHAPGLSVYINGQLKHHQTGLSPVNITLPNQTKAISALASAARYTNILANPNAPHQLPNISSDTSYVPSGSSIESYPAWKLIDGLLWYDTTPDNRWTSNGTSKAHAQLHLQLQRPRSFNSLSLAVFADENDGPGTISCPESILILDGRTGDLVASRSPWTDCRPNELNTILMANPRNGSETKNATTPAEGHYIDTDMLSIIVSNKIRQAAAFSELQIWVPAPTGPRYEAEDGLAGTFVGGFAGTPAGMNNSIVLPTDANPLGGGVMLHEGGWVEIADVRRNGNAKGETKARLKIIGSGPGTIEVQMNYLSNTTASFGRVSRSNRTDEVIVNVDFLPGGNVVTLFRTAGDPFIDAIEVMN